MCYYYVDAMHDYKSNPTGAESITTLVFFIKEITMSIYRLKTKNIDNISKIIPVLRRFDLSLSIADIRKRIEEDDYVVEYDLLHWEITEEIAGVDRISKLRSLIQTIEDCGAEVEIYEDDELIDKEFFNNRMEMLREISCEVDLDMDTERARSILIGLRDHLKAQKDENLYFQTRNACDAVRYLENASSDEEKEEIIRDYYRILFPGGRGGLSDTVLWDEDLETRKALNEPIVNAEKELWRIITEKVR